MKIDYMQALGVGISVAGGIAAAYAEYEGAGAATVPPIKTYLGSEHVEIDITIKHLPPP